MLQTIITITVVIVIITIIIILITIIIIIITTLEKPQDQGILAVIKWSCTLSRQNTVYSHDMDEPDLHNSVQ